MRTAINKPFILLLIVLHLVPGQATADNSDAVSESDMPVMRNVELGDGGVATGLVLDAEGQPMAKATIEIHKDDKVYKVTTDENGRIRVPGMTGGTCVIKIGESMYGCRFWMNGTAPPNSLQAFAIVDQSEDVIRGQDGNRSLFGRLRPPRLPNGFGFLRPISLTPKQLIGLGLLAAGITVAIIIAAQDDGDSSN